MHAEVHAIHRIIKKQAHILDMGGTPPTTGYNNHPEVRRWFGSRRLAGLKVVHDDVAGEMVARGYNHASPILDIFAEWEIPDPITPVEEQVELLIAKPCPCPIDGA